MIRVVILSIVLLTSLSTLAQQSSETPRAVYTAAQADAGERDFKVNKFGVCSSCHGAGLVGRKGDAGELPPLNSLSEDYQQLIRGNSGKVPQLVGPEFVARWSTRSTKDLTDEFKGRFDPPLTEEIRLNLIAYLLKANGAQPGTQPLTVSTNIEIRSLLGNPGK